MARELVALDAETLEIREVPDPEPEDGDAIVRSEYGSAKHGTETAFVTGYGNRGRFDVDLQLFEGRTEEGGHAGPMRVGNMIVGTVERIGTGVGRVAVGDRVAVHSSFRDVARVKAERCFRMADGMSWKSAVCLDPADFALAAVRDGNVRVGDAVAVFGLGAIGLMAVQVAKLAGAYPVIGLDPLANRRDAGTVCGADLVLDPTTCDGGREIKLATTSRGADVVIEYSGNVHAMQAALRGVAYGGTVVAGAFPPPYGAGLDFGAEAHLNRPNIVFTRACSEPNRDHPRWDEDRIFETCWRLLANGTLTGGPIVTPVVAFEDLVTGYPRIAAEPGSCIKIGCHF